MEKNKLLVRMLGRCSISYGDIRIEDTGKRANKVWLLLAYLLCNRERIIPQEELIEQLWGSEKNSNPVGALKTTLWRARTLLETFGLSVGRELIVNKDNGYGWNPEVLVEVDAEEFERLCREAASAADNEEKRSKLRAALAMYRNDFLERFSSEEWVRPLTAYYNNMYIQSSLEILPLLQTEAYIEESISLCCNVLRVSPYHEEVYQYLMQGLMELRDYKKADEVYEEMRELLFVQLGILPSEESQAIHMEILRHLNHRFLTADMLRDMLQEKDPAPGPLFCDFPVFRQFYHAEARSASRRGDAVHVGLLTIRGANDSELSQKELDRNMEQLRSVLQRKLRRGDAVSQCSVSQFVVLLLQANFENSNMVCERIVQAFTKDYPSTPVRIQYIVLPLEPLQTGSAAQNSSRPGKIFGWNM